LREMQDFGGADNHRNAQRDKAVYATDRQAAKQGVYELIGCHCGSPVFFPRTWEG
jgi:hypothetical protein